MNVYTYLLTYFVNNITEYRIQIIGNIPPEKPPIPSRTVTHSPLSRSVYRPERKRNPLEQRQKPSRTAALSLPHIKKPLERGATMYRVVVVIYGAAF